MAIKKTAFYLGLSAIFCLSASGNAWAMHISEGILPMKWAGLWYLVALPFVIKGIRDIKKKTEINPNFKVLLGLMGAVIFIISCMPVPVPTAGTCSHPAGTGISAVLVGPIMSILVTSIALLIQALFLAHGGLTTWGADIVSMGVMGSFAGYLGFRILQKLRAPLFVSGFMAGLLADWATYATTSFELASALHGTKPMLSLFYTILIAFIPTQLPLGILEGFLTGGMIVFVYKRRPDILSQLSVISFQPSAVSKKKIKKGKTKIVLIHSAAFKPRPLGRGRITPLSVSILSKPRSLDRGVEGLIVFLVLSMLFLAESRKLSAEGWNGIDVNVVEKIAQEHGRPAWTPFINTDQGDLLLFVFLLAGTAGGFMVGFCWRKLFYPPKAEAPAVSENKK